MNIIKLDQLHLPEAPNAVPQIDWGADFDAFDDKQKIIYLKKLASALNHSCDLIQKERNELLAKMDVLKKMAEHADTNVSQQKLALIQGLTNANAEKQELYRRIQELEATVKAREAAIEKLTKEE